MNYLLEYKRTLTCKYLIGSAITVLFPATHALNKGKVVGNGNGLRSCCCVFSCCNSCRRRTTSILTDANPPPLAPCSEQ